MTEHKPPVTQIGTVVIPVADKQQALAFYVGKLGFEKRLDAPFGDGDRWIEVAPPGAVTTIAFGQRDADTSNGTELSLDTTDAEAAHASLLTQSVDVDASVMRLDPSVPPMFTFRDPDGNRFRIVQRG